MSKKGEVIKGGLIPVTISRETFNELTKHRIIDDSYENEDRTEDSDNCHSHSPQGKVILYYSKI